MSVHGRSSVAALKSLLAEAGVDHSRCLEKSELVVLADSLGAGFVERETCMFSPLVARRAYRSFHGDFDGDTDESEDERAADKVEREKKNESKRARGAEPEGRATDVRLLPRSGRPVTVVSTADLHRHHDDKYIADGTLSLAEWFESPLAPGHIDLVLLAGDLGLDLNEELCERSRGIDRPATGARVTPRQNDAKSLRSFNALLRRICEAHPSAFVAISAGNHDGLLCEDDMCLACHSKALGRCQEGAWGMSPSAAAQWAREVLLEGVNERVRVLCDDHWDLTTANGTPVRVVGSPWTCYDTKGREHLSRSHHWRPEGGGLFGGPHLAAGFCGGKGISVRLDCEAWWTEHWERVGQQLRGAPADGISVLITHAPPHGALDIIGGADGSGR